MTEKKLGAVRDDPTTKYEASYNYHKGWGMYGEIKARLPELTVDAAKLFLLDYNRANLKAAIKENNKDNVALALVQIWRVLELLTPDVRKSVSLVAKYGANKYGDDNYRKGFPWSMLLEPLNRHLDAVSEKGLDAIDDGERGSGYLHVGHVGANVLMFLEHLFDDLGTNDLAEGENEKDE